MNKEALKQIGVETISHFREIKEKCPKEVEASLKGTVCYDFDMIDKLVEKMDVVKGEGGAGAAAPAAAAPGAPAAAAAAAAGAEETKVKPREEAKIDVLNLDTLECAIKMINDGFNPLVLNMASDRCLGGGFKQGSVAQEEEIFRRTTYAMLLTGTKIKKSYPLRKDQCIYSPNIFAFRASKKENYYLLDWKDCKWMSFIAMPAIRNPVLTDGKYNKEDEETMYSKIRAIFKVAVINKHDSLVLSALGAGCFNNPPWGVAKIFKQVIAEFKNQFKYIAFAILTDKNDKHGNFKIFKDILKPE
ncbi:MAG: hypothetical protein Harvfovirus13_11 [Harvfovirus sp.]|uniref:Microbial-type PARG catalytic domain-containing protein n=1 Tax=Harvfovirus sp. TaxID=2487768 RepID=A0A3G5A1C3_9VIRU|nr:MAG: hypothetical protein Harvfovirus13_11 [Harvfovirus sp.]